MNQNVNTNKRIVYIDAIKGFAMLCVVLGHVVDGYINSNMFPEQNHQMTTIYNGIYSFHMALFFLISGMLFSHSYLRKKIVDKNRIKNKALNLAGTYLIFSIIMGLFKILFGGYANNQVSVKDLLLIPVKTISPYWYLYVLIVFYIFALFGNVDFVFNNYKTILAVSLLLSVISNWVKVTNWFEIRRICYYFVFFYIGILFEKKVFKENRKIEQLIYGGGLLLACLSYRLGLYPIFKVLVALAISCGLIYIFENVNLLSKIRPFVSCGEHCMEIYAFHCFFTAGLRPVFKMLGLTSSCVISIILNMFVSILGSIIVALICKKNRIYDLFFMTYSFCKRFFGR